MFVYILYVYTTSVFIFPVCIFSKITGMSVWLLSPPRWARSVLFKVVSKRISSVELHIRATVIVYRYDSSASASK